MSLEDYLKLSHDGSQRWMQSHHDHDYHYHHDYDYRLGRGVYGRAHALEHLDHLRYGDHADIWRAAGPEYWEPGLAGPALGELHDGHGGLYAHTVEAFARLVLQRIEAGPPDRSWLPADMECLLSTTDNNWGIYGVGVVAPRALNPDAPLPQEELGENRLELQLDPAWLDRDFRNLGSRQPWLTAREAEWAAGHLREALRIQLPPTAVLRASLPPVPYGPASGDTVYWPAASGPVTPEEGVLGPGVTYSDRSGLIVEGYITAGHVAQPSQVELRDSNGALIPAQVDRSRLPGGLGTQLGAYLSGAVDGALVSSGGSPVRGLGPAGAAGPKCAANRVGGSLPPQGTTPRGQVVGYARWLATGNSAWGNCYTVAGLQLRAFAGPGDSGAAVLAGRTVLGIVVGGAAAVAGCPAVLTYVQDIEPLLRVLRCKLIP